MSNFEWFLLVVVVVAVPLLIAVIVTLWTLEMARQRKRVNRPGAAATIGVKRSAIRADGDVGGTTSSSGAILTSTTNTGFTSPSPHHDLGNETPRDDSGHDSGKSYDGTPESTPDASDVSGGASGGFGSGPGSDSSGGSDGGNSGGDSST